MGTNAFIIIIPTYQVLRMPLKLILKSKAKKDGEGEDLLNLYKPGAGGSKR